ncbi:MAG: DNA primase [Candidatus Shapirobacteria bacterium]
MDNQLEEIKARVDLVELIQGYVPLKKAGRNFKGLCPFHGEKTPSFMVSPERQIFKCFGCNEGGDVFGFLMKIEGLSFGEALRELAKRAGITLKNYQPTDEDKRRQLYFEINHLAAEFYHYLLLSHPSGQIALNYILGRGVSKNSLEKFKIGFAPLGWDNLQKFLVGKKAYLAKDLETLGLISSTARGSYFDRFRGRLTFPLKDARGNICGFAGRLVPGLSVQVHEEAKYVNTAETPLYHKSDLLFGWSEAVAEIRKADAAVLVEGELDMISSYQAGVKNTLAIKGSALTENQLRLLGRVTRNLILALDADAAGDAAARRGIELADQRDFSLKIVQIEGGKDPDEVARKDPLLWQKLVKKAVPVYDYLLDSLSRRFDPAAAEGKKRISLEFLAVLDRVSDAVVQAHYLKRLAQTIDTSEEVLNQQLVGLKKKPFVALSSPGASPLPSGRELFEGHLLALSFQAKKPLDKKTQALITSPRFCQIAASQSNLPAELKTIYDQLFLLDLSDFLDNEEKLTKEWRLTLKRLRQLTLEEKLAVLAQKIKHSDQESLLAKFSRLSQKLAQLQKS